MKLTLNIVVFLVRDKFYLSVNPNLYEFQQAEN